MDIVFCTTPIRPTPTTYPPFGSLAVIQSLRAAGFDPYFYDIDVLRPPLDEVEAFLRRRRPDVLAISAVVSTAYGYVKQLTHLAKRAVPGIRVVLGGNMAASAEILHRLGGVDICVIGEGEVVAVNLMRELERRVGRGLDFQALNEVRGITFLDQDGEMVFTGYEARLPADQVFNPDWSILEKFSRIEHFITEPLRPDFAQDERTAQPHRRGKMMATLVTAKGCVARCTFCHRWDQGYRAIPPEQIVSHVRMLMERYNVGFITFSDENFGSDKRQTRELIHLLKPLDILWQVGGVRVRSMTPELLKEMREAGCVAVYYGMETGSSDILTIMEKKTTGQDNLNAARWTQQAGLFTIFQMVLAMPGENEKTIRETTEFLKAVTQDVYESPRSRISMNYIQALPGTPVYEYARIKGLIGRSLADEEQYLLRISDIDADDDTKMLNFTNSDLLTVRSWRRRVVLEVMRHYYRYNRTPIPPFGKFLRTLLNRKVLRREDASTTREDNERVVNEYTKGGYFNLSRDLGYDVIVAYFYPFRRVILAAWLLREEFLRLPLPIFLSHIAEWLRHRLVGSPEPPLKVESLRETVKRLEPSPATRTERSMQPLRAGR